MRYIAKKAGQKFQQTFGNSPFSNQNPYEKPKEEVIIEKTPFQKRKSSNKVGEYVDYEEID